MGIMDDANDMKDKAKKKLDDTKMSDEQKRIEEMRRRNEELGDTTTDKMAY
jgi:hypothetical protein